MGGLITQRTFRSSRCVIPGLAAGWPAKWVDCGGRSSGRARQVWGEGTTADGAAVSGWPAKMFKVTAVDARTGDFVVFDSSGEAGLVDAVGASCAVPGVWPPVTIGNRRFMDGGMRSVANADLAASYQRVVIMAPVAQGIGPIMSGPGRQAAAPAAAGAVPRSCGRTARPHGSSGATCLSCRAGQRRRPDGPRQRPKRPRSGQSGRPMGGPGALTAR